MYELVDRGARRGRRIFAYYPAMFKSNSPAGNAIESNDLTITSGNQFELRDMSAHMNNCLPDGGA